MAPASVGVVSFCKLPMGICHAQRTTRAWTVEGTLSVQNIADLAMSIALGELKNQSRVSVIPSWADGDDGQKTHEEAV